MSNAYFCADLHIGHRNIAKYRECVRDVQDNTDFVVDGLNQKLSKRDTLFMLGDIVFHSKLAPILDKIPGRKILVLGNHDCEYSNYDTRMLHAFVDSILGFKKHHEFWLSHAPIHPTELRGKVNIHGHNHNPEERLDLLNYFNVNLDVILPLYGEITLSIEEIRSIIEERREMR